MFGFLKKKLKDVVDKVSKKVEEEGKKEEILEEKLPKKVKKKPRKIIVEEIKEIELPEEKPEISEGESRVIKDEILEEKPKEEKKGILGKIKEKIETRKINDKQFEEMFFDLELGLLENNIAVEVIEKIKQDLKMDLVDVAINKKEIDKKIENSLKESIKELFKVKAKDLVQEIKNKKEKPYIIVFIGINGSGKTTTIAKIANLLKENNLKCCLVAADTFRAASIEQLEQHGKNLDLKVIKHGYKADPAAVAFDGIKYAKGHGLDCVLIDTAGRLHSNINLMDELKKIIRIAKPDTKIFVGESITGNDAVEQANKFNDAVRIDSIILTKADVDEKGGAAISMSFVTGKPISFIGTGQEYNKLEKFDVDKIVSQLGL